MKSVYDQVAIETSRYATKRYSTSFSIGIKLLKKKFRDPIYAIYGFVRFADEIVDTFHSCDKVFLLRKFREDTYLAIDQKISMNPILHSFQKVVHSYGIDRELIDSFLHSMEMDLQDRNYNQELFKEYILGSAEVVGLMCLKVFLEGDNEKFLQLKPFAMGLGSAYQKINFLRDLKADFQNLGRSYFPGINLSRFSYEEKRQVEEDIEKDFKLGYQGIKLLPKDVRLGVYISYRFYYELFKKIKKLPPEVILSERVRIPDYRKLLILLSSYFSNKFTFA